MSKRALVLFAHGARNPDWAAPFERLRAMTQAQLPDTMVVLAFLDMMRPSFGEAVQGLVQAGCEEITVVPAFLAQAGHLIRDLPRLIEQAKQQYPDLAIKVAEAIGEDAEVLKAVAQYCVRSLDR